MEISHHAVDRYRERWAPSLSHGEAATQLRALANVAKPIRETSRRKGHELWATGEVKFVITRNTTDRTPLVVTVLPNVPTIDVAAEMSRYLDEEDRAALETPTGICAEAHDAYAKAGHDIFIANALIADGKELLSDAERRRQEARNRIIRGTGEP